jgi:predicted nucleic acid-binding protein
VRYWDASALVPLITAESRSEEVRGWLRDDPVVVTWVWTNVEIASAVERRVREGLLTRAERRLILDRFSVLAAGWDEVIDVLAVRARALPLLARHALRAADAAQLAAALLLRDELGTPPAFVCLDQRLALAAETEGLPTVPAP